MEAAVGRVYAGIDPSVKDTGIVVLNGEGRVLETCDVYGGTHVNDVEDIARYRRIADNTGEFLEEYGDISACYEHYSFNSPHKAFTLAELGGILKARVIPLCKGGFGLVPPTTVKTFATRDAFAEKPAMMDAAGREAGLNASSDVCDAYFLAKFAWYAYAPAETVVKHETNRALLRHRMEVVKKWKEQ